MQSEYFTKSYIGSICFLLGLGVGSLSTSYLLEKRFEKINKRLQENNMTKLEAASGTACLLTIKQWIQIELDERKTFSCEEVEKEVLEIYK